MQDKRFTGLDIIKIDNKKCLIIIKTTKTLFYLITKFYLLYNILLKQVYLL